MGQVTLAYHGCDIATRDDLVTGRISHLRASTNKYDWLGVGSYYFENDSKRALSYAQYSVKHPELQLTKVAIATPAVVGVVLDVSRWLDMTTQEGIENFKSAYTILANGFAMSGESPPQNQAAFDGDDDNILRHLDRAVFDLVHSERDRAHQAAMVAQDARGAVATAPFQATRSAFKQGLSVGPTSAIHGDSHIQIALRDTACVRGWFLVRGDKLLAPDAYEQAAAQRAAAKAASTAAKPRVLAKAKGA